MKFGIVSDSSCDLSEEYTRKENVAVVPFYVSFDGENYFKEGKEIKVTDFYKEMVEHGDCYPRTSMPSVRDYKDTFLPFAKEGIPVLCICLTQKFSGSLQAAFQAKTEMEEEYEEARIEVLDSRLVTALQGLFVKEAVRLRKEGISLEEAVKALKEIRGTGHIFFNTRDLKYLEHGGRIGKAASVAGSVLNIKPLLQYYDGELGPTELCRGRKKSLRKVEELFLEYLESRKIRAEEYLFATGTGLGGTEYEEFMERIHKETENRGYSVKDWESIQIGAAIGVHTGPYPIGVGLLKRCTL